MSEIRQDYKFEKDVGSFKETFQDKKNKVRKNIQFLYFLSKKKILNIARNEGFIEDGKIELGTVGYNNEYIYILYKPE